MTATKIQPGDDTHLTLLMAPHSLNLVTGADRAALLAYGRDVFAAARDSKCLAQIEEPVQPVCWIRFCSDGSTEGPIMHSQICEARKTSGAWTPLYAGAAPAAVAPALDVTLDEDQAGLLRDMLGDHAEYPEAITIRLMVGDGHSGHGLYVAQAEYQDEGAVLLASLPAPAAPALEAPATSLRDAAANALAALERTQHASDADRLAAADQLRAALAAAPQAPAAPSAIATQVIENLLQLARIVNTAVEDWGESFEDGSSEVTFHKEEADKLEGILEFFDSLPDAPPEEDVIESGPLRAARVLRSLAAPAAPAVDAPVKILSQAARDVLAERRRQVEAEGWTPEHDDQHDEGEMCFAAAGYAAVASDNLQAISRDIDRDLTLDDNVYPPTNYPWPRSWEFKPCTPRRALVKSGALILAEIERIDRCSPDAAQAAAKRGAR